jgi:MYXO-CTERM domain-containing protein
VLGNADDPQIARVALAGRGIGRTVEVGPTAIDLGAVAAGQAVRLGDVMPGAIGIRNTGAAVSFAISSVAITGSPAFRAIGPDRAAVAPGERAMLDVELTAGAAGRYDAEISVFLDGDPEPHARIAITALAIDPAPDPDDPHGGGCGCGTTRGSAQGLLPLVLLVLGLGRWRRPRPGR